MHEMSLAESVLQIAEEAAQAEARQMGTAIHIQKIILEVGQLSSVEPDALLFCFEAVSRNTLAENAVLSIEQIPGEAWCPHCATHVPVEVRYDACPHCGDYQLKITGGTEMRVKAIEIK